MEQINKEIKRRIINLIILFFLLILLGFLYYYLFITYDIGIPCMFHLITGLKCPSCGITRSIVSLINLDFERAFDYNNLYWLIILILGYYTYAFSYAYVKEKQIKNLPNIVLIILVIIFIIYAIIRNISILGIS